MTAANRYRYHRHNGMVVEIVVAAHSADVPLLVEKNRYAVD